MLPLAQLPHTLEAFHCEQLPDWPTDPWLFLVWWHCGYPASDAACAKGWASLTSQFSVDPDQLLSANPARLALALKPGGMVPELRAVRLKEIAERVQQGVRWRSASGVQRTVHCSDSCRTLEIPQHRRSRCRPHPALWRHLACGCRPLELPPRSGTLPARLGKRNE